MPLFDYECPAQHRVERLVRYAERDLAATCPLCGLLLERRLSAPHVAPDGILSYAPNIGSEQAWERRQQALKDGERVYEKVDSVVPEDR